MPRHGESGETAMLVFEIVRSSSIFIFLIIFAFAIFT